MRPQNRYSAAPATGEEALIQAQASALMPVEKKAGFGQRILTGLATAGTFLGLFALVEVVIQLFRGTPVSAIRPAFLFDPFSNGMATAIGITAATVAIDDRQAIHQHQARTRVSLHAGSKLLTENHQLKQELATLKAESHVERVQKETAAAEQATPVRG